jgi:hypothetical protein
MKKLLMCLVLTAVGCGKPPLPLATNETPVSTLGLPACDGRNFPIGKGGSSHCCVDSGTVKGKEQYFVIGMTEDRGFGHRYLGTACTTETRINENGQSVAVSFGPCGAAKGTDTDQGATSVHIFRPVSPSSPNECGYTYVKSDGSGTLSIPEEFMSMKQAEYPRVDAACRYTLCKGATPATDVTVVLTTPGGASMGQVVSNPPGITASRAGEFHGQFPGDVTLTAEPTGKHVRALFSGACTNTAGYGERTECVVKLAPDPKVTVSFECEKGFTCGIGSKH